MPSAVPLVDLRLQHARVAQAIAEGFARVFNSQAFILGDEVAQFEAAFARYCGVAHCVGVANGTDALELALRGLGIGPGDEVVLPTNSFIATALAVARAGATPVLADCDPDYLLLDPIDVCRRITPRTRAVVPVHLFGQMAPLEALHDVVRAAGRIALVEDAAQAHGATRHGRGIGLCSSAAATSFYPGKNLGAYGDAGAVLVTSDDVARRVQALRNYGSDVKYQHPETGFNSRLDALQAVVLSAKLAFLSEWNADRRLAASRYDELLAAEPSIVRPATLAGNAHVFHLYVVRLPRRDEALRRLAAEGIGAAIHYPVPIHLQGAFRSLGHRPGDFPVAELAAGEVMSLPMFPGITAEQQEHVVAALRKTMLT